MKALALKQYDLYKKSVSGVSDFTPTKYESAVISLSYKNKVFNCGDINLVYKKFFHYMQNGEACEPLDEQSFTKEQFERMKACNSYSFFTYLRL
jgi:hypothetical protein